MSNLKELLSQREALDNKIAEIRKLERSEAIGRARSIISEYELTQEDLFGGVVKAQNTKAVNKVEAKYRDPETGKEWSGRGLPPKWLNGRDKEEFLISK